MFLAVRSITQTGTLRFCLVTLFNRCFLPNGLLRAIKITLNISPVLDAALLLVGGHYERIRPIGIAQ